MSSTQNDKNDEVADTPPCAAGGNGEPHPFSMLPGDPSMVLITNVDLGDKKLEIMKGMLFVTWEDMNDVLCVTHDLFILCGFFE